PDCNEQVISAERRTVFERDGDARVVLLGGLEARAERILDSATAGGALEALAERDVLVGDEMRQRLDDRDLGTEGTPDAGELAADHSTAENENAFRDDIQRKRLLAGEDAPADLETRQRSAVGTGREDDIAAGVHVVAHRDRAVS